MSDFHDFLRHEYAYVAMGEFKPGKFEQAKNLYEQAVSTYIHGFKGAYLLQELGTDRGIAVIFWENLEDMQANQSSACEEILKQMSSLFTCPPNTSFYELVCEVHPKAEPKSEALSR